MGKICYVCGKPASSREHFPPKCLFPKREGLQLKTVPSCFEHNNAKSNDDQYFLAQLVLSSAHGKNLPGRKYFESIRPQLIASPGFKKLIVNNSISLNDGSRMYSVDVRRMWNVMDGICHAIFFDKYKSNLDLGCTSIRHEFLNLISGEPQKDSFVRNLLGQFDQLLEEQRWTAEGCQTDNAGEPIYSFKLFAPAGPNGSITLQHTFYDHFKVVSFLTRSPVLDVNAIERIKRWHRTNTHKVN